ncbi:LOW QUALITY PROTEIN: olfactory receptor 4S1-like [Geothlypis trichas]
MKELILPGLSENQGAQKMYFVMFLLLYTLTVAGNLTVLTVTSSRHLNSPMYFFICHLSFVDVCYSSVTAPQMISGSLMENNTISFAGCIGRHFGLHFFDCTEVFILTAMAYNRCMAICRPLCYHRLCGFIVGVSWAGGFLHSTLRTLPTTLFPFCGPHKDAHFFYDDHLLPLACANTRTKGLANSGVISLSCFPLVMSYVGILASLRGTRLARWHKALSTCRSHITAVILCLGPSMFVYICPSGGLSEDRSTAVFYTLITPIFNPLIDTLRELEVKGAMRKLCRRKVGSGNGKA